MWIPLLWCPGQQGQGVGPGCKETSGSRVQMPLGSLGFAWDGAWKRGRPPWSLKALSSSMWMDGSDHGPVWDILVPWEYGIRLCFPAGQIWEGFGLGRVVLSLLCAEFSKPNGIRLFSGWLMNRNQGEIQHSTE